MDASYPATGKEAANVAHLLATAAKTDYPQKSFNNMKCNVTNSKRRLQENGRFTFAVDVAKQWTRLNKRIHIDNQTMKWLTLNGTRHLVML
jgi:hypothetical protein